jgi:hypothetical protein
MKISHNFKIYKRNLFFIIGFVSVISFTAGCRTKINILTTDVKSNTDILIGRCNRQAFENVNFKDWFNEEYFGYHPEEVVIDEITTILGTRKLDVLIVFGTWCSDSQREVPRFYKIFDNCGLLENNMKLVAVDRQKKSGDKQLDGIKIEKVPTFIFYENTVEIGRIVETPTVSLEKDMLEIIK